MRSHLSRRLASSIALTQTTKTPRQGDGVLDREVVAGDDDTLEEEADESLPSGEVEDVESVAERRRECGDVVGDPADAVGIHLLARQVLAAYSRGVHRGVETLASGLKLLHAHGSSLIRVEESLDLELKLPLRRVELRDLLLDGGRSLAARLPGCGLSLEHLRTLDPRPQLRSPDPRQLRPPRGWSPGRGGGGERGAGGAGPAASIGAGAGGTRTTTGGGAGSGRWIAR